MENRPTGRARIRRVPAEPTKEERVVKRLTIEQDEFDVESLSDADLAAELTAAAGRPEHAEYFEALSEEHSRRLDAAAESGEEFVRDAGLLRPLTDSERMRRDLERLTPGEGE